MSPLRHISWAVDDLLGELASYQTGGTISISDQRARIRRRVHRDRLWSAGLAGEQLSLVEWYDDEAGES